MKYLAHFAPANEWSDDLHRAGLVPIEFEGHIIHARAHQNFPNLVIPSIEWITKYREYFWVFIEQLEDSAIYVWTGIAPIYTLPNGQPPFSTDLTTDPDLVDFTDASKYPYIRIPYLTENWRIVTHDQSGANTLQIKHTDGTLVQFDRTTGRESTLLYDGKHGSYVRFDASGTTLYDGVTRSLINITPSGISILDKGTTQTTISGANKLAVTATTSASLSAPSVLLGVAAGTTSFTPVLDPTLANKVSATATATIADDANTPVPSGLFSNFRYNTALRANWVKQLSAHGITEADAKGVANIVHVVLGVPTSDDLKLLVKGIANVLNAQSAAATAAAIAQPVARGTSLVDLLNTILNILESHTHIDPQGGVTKPPIPTDDMTSAHVQIQFIKSTSTSTLS